MFFGLEASGRITAGVLNDSNADLIEAYIVVRDSPGGLLAELGVLADAYLPLDRDGRADIYYRVRCARPGTPAARAARLLFLNRTCYNGLYRVNQRGEFNVPHGDYARPRILDREGILACSAALAPVELKSLDFEEAVQDAGPGDLVYFDPPYHPLSRTSSFTAYTSSDFGKAEQCRLARVVDRLTQAGVAVILSNSAHPFVEALYAGYAVSRVPMARAINSAGDRRGSVDELLVTNFGQLNASPK